MQGNKKVLVRKGRGQYCSRGTTLVSKNAQLDTDNAGLAA